MKLRSSIVVLTLWFAASIARATEPGGLMLKQDAVPVVFVAGVKAAPGAELDAWLATRAGAEIKLPITIWRTPIGDVDHAALGVVTERPAQDLRLQDLLGIALSDRLRSDCGADPRCVVWLSGQFGALVGEPAAGTTTFSVLGFHGVVGPDEVAWASAARPPECLALRAMHEIHCARGADRCARCRQAAAAPEQWRLLDVCPDDADKVARPVTEVVRAGVTEYRVFDVVRVFADEAEARAFAAKHAITDVATH